jgi:hypothetical protein
MPLLRYFLYVGGALLALLLIASAYLPEIPSAETSGPHLPVIHLYAEHRGPESLVYDTSAPLIHPAPVANAGADKPPEAAAVDASSRVSDAFAQLPPPDADKVQSAEQKKAEPKPPPRKIAKRHTVPRVRMVDRQPQFDWFGQQQRFW